MRLLTIANRYYFTALIVVFLVGGLVAYNILISIINKEFNDKLFAEKEQLIYELKHYQNLEKTYYLNIGDMIELEEISGSRHISTVLKDTVMFDKFEKKQLPFRQLSFSGLFNNKYYKITISKSLLSNQDLIEGISEIMLGIAIILMIALGLLNRVIFLKLWAPFHQTINQLHQFKITQPEQLNLTKTNVNEFKELNEVLDKMISKSIQDYVTLKDYTENTSHEIQTPLAIIKNKAEILLQEPLSEKHLYEISKIYEASGRLSRLKDGLSMLTKIENNQYIDHEQISLRQFLESRLAGFEELMELKNIELSIYIESDHILEINNDLAYILFNNLISNAIKHNLENGRIWIELNDKSFKISNTGLMPEIPTEQLFERFKKSGNSHDSTGLGLSLVKRIVEQYNMKVDYIYKDGIHAITIFFDVKSNFFNS